MAALQPPQTLSEQDMFERQEYQKILRFADAVLSQSQIQSQPLSGPLDSASRVPTRSAGTRSLKKKPREEDVTSSKSLTKAPAPKIAKADSQRTYYSKLREDYEKELKADLEEQCNSRRGPHAHASDLDLSDVLAKALSLVQDQYAPPTDHQKNPDANNQPESDSFDDATFYSSQHDTPEPSRTESPAMRRVESMRASVPLANDAQEKGPAAIPPLHELNGLLPDASKPDSDSYEPPPAVVTMPSYSRVPGLTRYASATMPTGTHSEQAARAQLGHTSGAAPITPLVRNHDLVPAAPQPVQISSLTGHSHSSHTLPAHVAAHPAQSAQVSNLKNHQGMVVDSPDSSSQSGGASGKGKKQKKKRKADRQAPDADVARRVKAEPRSPSPLSTPAFIRPSKRARRAELPLSEQGAMSEPRRQPLVDADVYSPRTSLRQVDQGLHDRYAVRHAYPSRAASTTFASGSRHAGDVLVEASQRPYVQHPPPGDSYPTRVEAQVQPMRQPSRMAIHDLAMAPPHMVPQSYEDTHLRPRFRGEYIPQGPDPAPPRILVDSTGREYIEPRSTSVRYSVAPPGFREPEAVYERTLSRAASRHPHGYEPPSAISYPAQLSPAGPPRRVVTQPAYASPGFRVGEGRGYSTRPIEPAGEVISTMGPPDRRPMTDAEYNRYVARSTTTRPEMIRYEAAPEYVRVDGPSQRDLPMQQYRASAWPEARYDGNHDYVREVRDYPMASQPQQVAYARREYGTRPPEAYYEPASRGADEIAYIERPRAVTQEVVYADDTRRELYR